MVDGSSVQPKADNDRSPADAQQIPSRAPSVAEIHGPAPVGKETYRLLIKTDERGQKKMSRSKSVGLELAREINEAAAVPIGSTVAPISKLRRVNQYSDAS